MENWWDIEPWRMIQTNLRQIDMENINAKEYVKQLKDFDATVAMINVGGILANYPTKVEDHPINPHLHGDDLQKVMEACRQAGIRIIARVDYSKIRREVYEKHPDWAYRTKEGNIVDYNGNIHACLCGGFQQEKAFEITNEIVSSFPVDGFFINMGGFQIADYSYNYYGPCHCDHCKQGFYQAFGLPLPERDDMADSVYRKYILFKKQVMTDYRKKITEFIHKIKPEVAVEGTDFVRLESNTEYKRLPWLYDSSSTVRGIQSMDTGIRCSNPSVDFVGYFYRHVSVSPAHQRLRMWQTLANGGLLDYYIISRLDNHEDRSGYEAIKTVFRFHKKYEKHFAGLKFFAEALLIRSGGYAKSSEGNGWVQAFSQSHILLHETEPEGIKNPQELSRYKAVILADVEMPSANLAEILDQYAANGGCLIVTGNSVRYTSDGEQSQTLPFASLGYAPISYIRQDMRSAMLKLNADDHKIFPMMTNSDLFFFGDEFLFVKYPEQGNNYLHLIPPHNYGPPELCFYTQTTGLPGVAVLPWEKGKAVHIPWKPGALYADEGYENTYAFLHGILTQIAGLETVEENPFSPMVEVTWAETADGCTIAQLVNGSGHFGQSFFEPLPISEIALKLPCKKEPKKVISLTTEHKLNFHWGQGILYLTVECLQDYEAILVE